MVDVVVVAFLIVALVLFLVSAFGVAAARVNLLALGLAFWVAAVVIEAVEALQ